MDIATLAVKLIADATEFAKGLDKSKQQAQTWAKDVSKNLKNVGGDMMDFGKKATTYMTLPIVGAGVAAINMASDLEETKNKVNVVFGDMSSTILNWSQNAATSMGQSQQQALDAAGTYGNLFLTLGLGQKPAADMSMSLVQLASDLASFNNANPADVLQALQSGLIGQSEPMRKFGVNLSEAAVQAKAMEMGLVGADGEISEAAKVQARYALIMAQSTTAQGDFLRTADGLANSQRIVTAQIKDAGAALGQQLLPYALQFVNWAREMVSRFQALTPQQQKMIIMVLGIAAAIGPVVTIIGGLVSAIGAVIGILGAITTPVLIVIAVIAALVAIGYVLYRAWTGNWGGIQQKTQMVLTFIRGLIAQGMNFIHNLTSGKLGAMSAIWTNSMNAIKTIVGSVMNIIRAVIGAVTAAIRGDWYGFGQQLRVVWDNVWKIIATIVKTAWTNIKTGISALIKNVINFFKTTNWKEVGLNIVKGIANGITSATSWAVKAIMGLGDAVIKAIKGFLGIASPAKLPKLEVGIPIGQGIGEGIEESVMAVRAKIPSLMNGLIKPKYAFASNQAATSPRPVHDGGLTLNNYGTVVLPERNQRTSLLRQLG